MLSLLENHLGDFASGLWVSLELTLAGFAGAFVLGTILATFRISPIAPLRAVGLVYVEIFRNIPVLSLIVLLFFALPNVQIRLGFMPSVYVALMLVGASFVCEALRSGVNSIAPGQIEAARAIGLSFVGVLIEVVLPQAFRAMVQPFVTILIGLFLSSSLASQVSVFDLTQTANDINNREALGLITFVVAACIYVAVCLIFAWCGSLIERKARILR